MLSFFFKKIGGIESGGLWHDVNVFTLKVIENPNNDNTKERKKLNRKDDNDANAATPIHLLKVQCVPDKGHENDLNGDVPPRNAIHYDGLIGVNKIEQPHIREDAFNNTIRSVDEKKREMGRVEDVFVPSKLDLPPDALGVILGPRPQNAENKPQYKHNIEK